MHPADIRGDGARIDARHFEDVLKETIQSLDFRQNQVALLPAIRFVQPRRLKIAGRHANGGQRRSQDRDRARRAAPTSAPRSAAPVPPPCALRGIARARRRWRPRRPARRASRLDRPPGGRQQSDRLGADQQRHEPHRDVRRTVIARCLAYVLACASNSTARSGAGERPRQFVRVELKPPASPLDDLPIRRRGRQIATKSRSKRRETNVASWLIACLLSVVSRTSRLRSNSRASSSRRATASRARSRAVVDRLLATMPTARKANNATQFCGSAIVKVPIGGMKK